MNKIISENPYPDLKNISVKNVNIQGWLHESNKLMLDKYIKILNPKIILELGAWKGLFTLYMLNLFDGIVISVDS